MTHKLLYLHGASGSEWVHLDESVKHLSDSYGHTRIPYTYASAHDSFSAVDDAKEAFSQCAAKPGPRTVSGAEKYTPPMGPLWAFMDP